MRAFSSKKVQILMLILSGALTALPLVFPILGFLQWFSMIPMAIVLISSRQDGESKLKSYYVKGILYFWPYYAIGFHWFFYMYPLDFAGLSNAESVIVVVVACFGLSLFQALWSAVAFLLFGLVLRSDRISKNWMLIPIYAAALWVVVEIWQTVGWWGVPWARIPLGQISSLLFVRSSALFGSYFVTFVIVAVNFLISYAIIKKAVRGLALALGAVVFSINLVLGALVTMCYKPESSNMVKAAAIQGNISSGDKWDSETLYKTIEVYKDLTEKAAADGAKIAVWPETALPCVLFDSEELSAFVKNLARENNITIILSAFTKDDNTGQRYNSMIEVRPDGTFGDTVYSKQRLVPFGEFVPMRELVMFLIPPLSEIGMLEGDLLFGKESIVISTKQGMIGCGICFDSIYEDVISNGVRNGAELIAVSTNDSWFSDSAALSMHNSQSRLRAIENGRYIVRSANTGISSVIDPLGNIEGELGALKEGYVISDVEMRESRTLYTYIGNLFAYLCIVFSSALILVYVWERTEKIKILKKH